MRKLKVDEELMRTNNVKAKLKRGEVSAGGWLSIGNIATARLMSRIGFDWLTIDAEHTAQHPELMAAMVATVADSQVCAPFVRVPTNSVEWFKWALDAGAWGVIVPMVNTREEAERAVSWAKYPPQGTRSIGGVFAQYGFGTTNRSEYAANANDEIMVIIQIESPTALENLEEILSVPGIDVAFIGPNDLHALLGLTPSSEGAEPEFVAALEKVKEVAGRYNIPLGIFCSNGQAALQRTKEGFQMVSTISDTSCLALAATQNLWVARGNDIPEPTGLY
jgi:4-hydroxy-2-oxoheptanedioate aldolase